MKMNYQNSETTGFRKITVNSGSTAWKMLYIVSIYKKLFLSLL